MRPASDGKLPALLTNANGALQHRKGSPGRGFTNCICPQPIWYRRLSRIYRQPFWYLLPPKKLRKTVYTFGVLFSWNGRMSPKNFNVQGQGTLKNFLSRQYVPQTFLCGFITPLPMALVPSIVWMDRDSRRVNTLIGTIFILFLSRFTAVPGCSIHGRIGRTGKIRLRALPWRSILPLPRIDRPKAKPWGKQGGLSLHFDCRTGVHFRFLGSSKHFHPNQGSLENWRLFNVANFLFFCIITFNLSYIWRFTLDIK